MKVNATVKILSLFLLMSALIGCSNSKLQPLNKVLTSVVAYGSVDAHFCTAPPTTAQENVKYLFVMDHSASNQPGFPLVAGDDSNTDPQGSRRYGPMVNFVQNLVSNPNVSTSFDLIDFNDTATQPGGLTGFDSNSNDFVSIADSDWAGAGTAANPQPYDKGFTNYQAALQMALQVIQNDLKSQALMPVSPIVKTVYQIIFVSDGVPTVATATGTYTQTFANDIGPVIASLMGLKSDPTYGPFVSNISLSTAYYYNTVQLPSAETLLQQMANAGNGQYLQFSAGQNVMYQSFAPAISTIRNELVDVFVENVNGVWWDNGQFMLDTAGDGLPDFIKEQMGANPNLADSDGNGVSDYVEYRLNGHPCQDGNCNAANRNPYSICDGFNPVTDANGKVTFSSSTNDGLNNCEKFLLNASRTSFNTNGDLIPDLFAFKNTLQIVPGSASTAYEDPFGDGITNYDKLKDGLPIAVSDKELTDFTARSTNLTPDPSPSPDVDCYHLSVSNIALSALNNTLKVMVVQNSSAGQSIPFLTQASTQVDSNLSVRFSAGDFK